MAPIQFAICRSAVNLMSSAAPPLNTYLTKRDAVAEWLRSEILRGGFEPGSQLTQDDIARRLAVSPTPVREAFRVLEAEGLLDSKPHHGVTVALQDYDEIRAAYEIRAMVEVRALRRAENRIDDEALTALSSLVQDSERAINHPDLTITRTANTRFHEALVHASGSRLLTDLARTLVSRSAFYIPLDRDRIVHVVNRHRRILEALVDGRHLAAVEILEDHLHENLAALYAARPSGREGTSVG